MTYIFYIKGDSKKKTDLDKQTTFEYVDPIIDISKNYFQIEVHYMCKLVELVDSW